jgi:hypothetical protein
MPAKSSALGKLGDLLRDPTFRDAFVADYRAALREKGITESSLPATTLATLRGMGGSELKAVANLNISMDADNVSPELKSQMV